MKKRVLIGIASIGIIGAASFWAFAQYDKKQNNSKDDGIVHYAASTPNQSSKYNGAVDFTAAAEQTVKSVVHITTETEVAYQGFWGVQQQSQTASGSGVIISEDGYIITNDHVVKGAESVKVTFSNNTTKTAKVIGTDPSSDLAVIKVEGNNYPYIVFGNSDEVKLGQWVLAVGYPFNLDATVTAGIVSAKSRNIGINRRNSNYAIESFIQTDAAVNMGNSGGALVNTDGLLIGINSAIATPTGTYAGYSYAIPSNLARKVANDIIGHGSVQRGFMGAQLIDMSRISENDLAALSLPSDILNGNVQGVIVADVMGNSGAAAAGLQRGDIIISADQKTTNNSSQLMEAIALHHPGDKVQIEYLRDNKTYTAEVLLKSQDEMKNTVAQLKGNSNKKYDTPNDLGSEYYNQDFGFGVTELTADEKSKYGIENGVKISELDPNGKLSRIADIRDGFVITKLNGKTVNTAEDVEQAMQGKEGIRVNGTYLETGGSYSFYYR